MFSFFKKSPKKPEYTENVWTEKAYKYQALHQDMLNAIDSGEKVFIFTHFEKTLKEICFVLEQMKVNFYQFSKGDDTSIISFNQVVIFQADALQKNTIHQLQRLPSHAPALFYIIEHFPIRQNDEELLATLFEISPRSKPIFYISLDDAVLQQFVTTNLKQILEKLGIKPEESINLDGN